MVAMAELPLEAEIRWEGLRRAVNGTNDPKRLRDLANHLIDLATQTRAHCDALLRDQPARPWQASVKQIEEDAQERSLRGLQPPPQRP